MEYEKVFEKVKKIIVGYSDDIEEDEVKEDSTFVDDLGFDSMDTVELVLAFVEEFGIDIPDGKEDQYMTVGRVVKFFVEETKDEG